MSDLYLYILVMSVVTYLVRMLPLVLMRREIHNRFIRSFLYYVPYACLAAMTVPAIFFATDHLISAALGFACALFLASDDGLVSPDNSKALAKALEEHQIPCRLEIGPEGGHGFADGSGMCMAGWTERAVRWFDSLKTGSGA